MLRNAVLMTRSDRIFMEKRAGGNFRDWEIWGVSSLSGDARTWRRDPGNGRMV